MNKGMFYVCLLLICDLTLGTVPQASAQVTERGDTIFIKAFGFDDPDRAWVEFPPDSVELEKITMHYRLGCPNGSCGQWDYHAYIRLRDYTGEIDSTLEEVANFLVDNAERDTFFYMRDTSWAYSWNAGIGAPDSTPLPEHQLVLFNNLDAPEVPTDTLTVWPTYYRYTFDNSGEKLDSTLVPPDSVLYREYREYWRRFEVVVPYELARYITPYGSQLPSDWDYTFKYDVSDYRPLLTDSAFIDATNWHRNHLIEVTFVCIKGTPPRKPSKVMNLWRGNPRYGVPNRQPIEEFLTPITVNIDEGTEMARVKLRTTGHGFGGTDNCAEFCPRTHTLQVGPGMSYDYHVWRDDCGENPVFPQNGTWVYDRANWCPGDVVHTANYEITRAITPGENLTLGYRVPPFTWQPNPNGSSEAYYTMESQLVLYDTPPSFEVDAAVVDILAPTNYEYYNRINPICNNPVVTIQNTGGDPLTSLEIVYGPRGGNQNTYNWTGNLNIMERDTVTLPPFSWGSWSGENVFEVEIRNPNGQADPYARNNQMESYFEIPPQLDSLVILQILTNEVAVETSYELTDADGNEIAQYRFNRRQNNIVYADTFNLDRGCYTLRILDSGQQGEDGLDFSVYNNDGAGSVFIRTPGQNPIYLEPNFGSEISYRFTVGYTLDNDTATTNVSREPVQSRAIAGYVYPNPAREQLHIGYSLAHAAKATLTVTDTRGQEVHIQEFEKGLVQEAHLDVSAWPAGLYVVRVQTDSGTLIRKVLVQPE